MPNNNSAIKFTVIIPTRERPDTLKWALKTCTTQNYDNFEIIVSDNFSQDETRRVVEDAKDPRVRYLNTGKRISMTANFEFGLSHATGDYVCFIGDDDGLLPNALAELAQLLAGSEIEAVSWNVPVYIWNSWYEEDRKNTLQVLLDGDLRKLNCRETLEDLLAFMPSKRLTYSNLVSLYHGFVKTEAINKLRLKDGRFFNSMAPDVYASVALTSTLQNFWRTAVPYSLAGASHHSTGTASVNTTASKRFWSEVDIPAHPMIKDIPPSAAICAVESLLQAQEVVPAAKQFNFNAKGLVRRAMEEAVYLPAEHYGRVVETVTHLGDIYGVADEAREAIAQNRNSERPAMLFGYNPLSKFLVLKLDERKVKNIYDATVVCKQISERRSRVFFFRQAARFASSCFRTFGIRSSVDKLLGRARVAQPL